MGPPSFFIVPLGCATARVKLNNSNTMTADIVEAPLFIKGDTRRVSQRSKPHNLPGLTPAETGQRRPVMTTLADNFAFASVG